MLISREMAGFSLPDADKLRKAMGKKIPELIDQMEEKFLKGAKEKKVDVNLAKNIFELIRKFGRYGFNKSHSAAYALVSYQTAYLKAHYTIEYMTALLSAQLDKLDDIAKYVNDCKSSGIQLLPPDVNHSYFDFTIEGDNIRFGLGAIKGIGEKAIESIVSARDKGGAFKSLVDFLERIDLGTVNKGSLEALVKAGALDGLHGNRAQIFISIDHIIEITKRMQQDKSFGQGNLFSYGEEDGTGGGAGLDLPEIRDWPDIEKLNREKEVLGVYISGHPLARYEKEIRAFSCTSIARIPEMKDAGAVSVVGVIQNLKKKITKNGKNFAISMIEDLDGMIETVFFPRVFAKYEDLISSDEPVLLKGSLEFENETPKKILVSEVRSLREARNELISAIHIKIDLVGLDDSVLEKLKLIIENNKGACQVFLHLIEKKGIEKIVKAHPTYNIAPSDNLLAELSSVVGRESIRYSIRCC